MIEAIIFDMDGVIIDSEPLWKKAIINVMRRVGYDFTIDMCNRTKGMRVDEVISYWKIELKADFDSNKLSKEIVEEVISLIKKEGKSVKGLDKLLEKAKKNNLKIALASSSPSIIINVVLNKLNIADFFDVVQSAEKEDFGKPHPGVFITTAEKLNVSPENCLVIEDSLNGVIAGKAAKMKVVAIPEKEEKQLIKFSIADAVVDKLTEIRF
ncbi:hexitol phosphatase HxpB [Flavobacteriales bacterium]|nr:hexitol phosphatase HxpB [Flavobacteriales bacterium]